MISNEIDSARPARRTCFIPAYDTECPRECLRACERIVEVHDEADVPATFFLVSSLLEGDERAAYVRLLADPRFEVASHSRTHRLRRDPRGFHRRSGHIGRVVDEILLNGVRRLLRRNPIDPWSSIVQEVVQSKATIEDAFSRPCIGFRTPVGYEDGLGADRRWISLFATSGYRYISSQLWGPLRSLPAPLQQARAYADQGFPDLWELPGHGWHENILKGYSAVPSTCLLWPPVYPDHLLRGFVATPEEEFEVHRFFIDKAIELSVEYVSLILHPWSLGRFDPEMRMLSQLIQYVRGRGCTFDTYAGLRVSRTQVAPDAAERAA